MATVERTRALKEAGYHVIEKWECDDIKTKEKTTTKKQTKRTRTRFSTTLSRFKTAQREKRRLII